MPDAPAIFPNHSVSMDVDRTSIVGHKSWVRFGNIAGASGMKSLLAIVVVCIGTLHILRKAFKLGNV